MTRRSSNHGSDHPTSRMIRWRYVWRSRWRDKKKGKTVLDIWIDWWVIRGIDRKIEWEAIPTKDRNNWTKKSNKIPYSRNSRESKLPKINYRGEKIPCGCLRQRVYTLCPVNTESQWLPISCGVGSWSSNCCRKLTIIVTGGEWRLCLSL